MKVPQSRQHMMIRGFSLTEVMIVVSVVGILMAAGVTIYNDSVKSARDNKRIADIEQIRTALELYYQVHGDYPDTTPTGNLNTWETSISPTFMASLNQYINKTAQDPINVENSTLTDAFVTRPNGDYYYAYNYYNDVPDGADADTLPDDGQFWGCDFDGPFAVIAIRSLEERSNLDDLPRETCGPQPCPIPIGGGANACVDWFAVFDYSVILHQ